jgi:hypothetical protein
MVTLASGQKVMQESSAKKKSAINNSIEGTWFLKKKGKFTGSTWINCYVKLRYPSMRAQDICATLEIGNE